MPDSRVHQVVYRWSERTMTGNKGVGPVASSMTVDDLREWRPRLDAEIWAATQRADDPAGLSYLEVGGEGVVIHKLSVNDQNGRPGSTLTHVLVADAGQLGPIRALGLAGWEHWFREGQPLPSDGVLPVLDADQLVEAAATGIRPIRAQARSLPPGPVEQLVCRVLDDLDGRFSVLAADLPVQPLLCAALDVLGPIGGRWTFAAQESSDEGSGRPRLIFLTQVPETAAVRPRLTLDWEPLGSGEQEQFVATFVDAYRRGDRSAIRRFWPAQPLGGAKQVTAWMRDCLAAPGVLNDPYGLLCRAGAGILSPAETQYVAQTDRTLVGVLDQLAPARFLTLLNAWADGPGRRQWPGIDPAIVDEALDRALAPEQAGPELRAATAALRPGPAAVHAATERRLTADATLAEPARTRARLTLLMALAGLALPPEVAGPTEGFILSGVPTVVLVEQAAVTTSARWAELLLATLEGRTTTAADADRVYAALLQHRLLLPVLDRFTAPEVVMDRLRDLLLRLFGDAIGGTAQLRQVLSTFGDPVPTPVLGALRMVATSMEGVRLVDEVAARHLYRAAGRPEAPAARVRPAPPRADPGPPRTGSVPAGPPREGPVDEAGPEPRGGLTALLRRIHLGPILLVFAIAVVNLLVIALLLLSTY